MSLTADSSIADDSHTKIWRYFDLAKFISLLSKRSLYFACPPEFDDPYEGLYPKSHIEAFSSITQKYLDDMITTRNQIIERYPGVDVHGLNTTITNAADRFRKGFDEVRLKFGISCWHKNENESAAMWKLYFTYGAGLAIESTVQQLRQSISDDSLQIGDVRYVNFENDPIKKGHRHYGLFLKRKSFEHEQELRATVLLKKEGKGAFVNCDLEKLITKIYIAPLAPTYFREVVYDICSANIRSLHKPVIQSSLLDKPARDYSLNLNVML